MFFPKSVSPAIDNICVRMIVEIAYRFFKVCGIDVIIRIQG